MEGVRIPRGTQGRGTSRFVEAVEGFGGAAAGAVGAVAGDAFSGVLEDSLEKVHIALLSRVEVVACRLHMCRVSIENSANKANYNTTTATAATRCRESRNRGGEEARRTWRSNAELW